MVLCRHISFNNIFCQLRLFLLKLKDFFLNRIFSHQLKDGHYIFLANTVGPVRGLILGRHIPPRVIVDHHFGSCQVQYGTSGFQLNEKYRYIAFLELIHHLAALLLGGLS